MIRQAPPIQIGTSARRSTEEARRCLSTKSTLPTTGSTTLSQSSMSRIRATVVMLGNSASAPWTQPAQIARGSSVSATTMPSTTSQATNAEM